MKDLLSNFLVNLQFHYGVVGVFLLSSVALMGGSATVWCFESRLSGRYSRYYAETKDIPLHRNYSTLADFLILNPLLLAIIASATGMVVDLPACLAGKVALTHEELAPLNSRFLALVCSRWVAWLGVAVSLVVWFWYLGRTFKGNLRSVVSKMPLVEVFISFGTALTIYFIITFMWRIGVTLWYISVVTSDGFKMDSFEWSGALATLVAVLSRLNAFFAVLAVIVVVMFIHDYRIHAKTHDGRKARVKGILVAGVLSFAMALIPIISIHENLAEVKDARIEELMISRRKSSDEQRVVIEKQIMEIRGFDDWVLGESGGLVAIAWQLLLVVGSGLVDIVPRLLGKISRVKDSEAISPS